jgi:hypothetical protein
MLFISYTDFWISAPRSLTVGRHRPCVRIRFVPMAECDAASFRRISKDLCRSLPESGTPKAPTFLDSLTLKTRTLVLLETSGTTHRPTELHQPATKENSAFVRKFMLQSWNAASAEECAWLLNSVRDCWTVCVIAEPVITEHETARICR